MNYSAACYLFILALFGHLFGDYFFQPKAWALQKSNRGWKAVALCSVHVLVYTLCVMALWKTAGWQVFVAVFVPHWVIDRWSLANKWLKLIRGRTFEDAFHSHDQYREFDIAFTSIVYTIVDNGAHLLSLWAVVNWWLLK